MNLELAGPVSWGLGLLAGLLSTLSPCVLPLLPLVAASAIARHRLGLWALAGGLALSYAGLGLLLAWAGPWSELNAEDLQGPVAWALTAAGLLLLVPAWQRTFARALGGWEGRLTHWRPDLTWPGWTGQAATGLALGLVWVPCVGPTLGAAVALAAQGEQWGQAGMVMALFALGAALPLLVVGRWSRATLQRWRPDLVQAGRWGRPVLGAALLFTGLARLTQVDHALQAWLLQRLPIEWLAWSLRY